MPTEQLKEALRLFTKQRDWNQYHTPKNLAMAMSVEMAELVEIFQWKTAKQSAELSQTEQDALADEVADVLIYLTMLADKFDMDPIAEAWRKIEKNRLKYPESE
ncbi:MAG: nucleotide pyrophosphohydrolase [Magnetococcales bacterium]|nr:nucleotide pyrophosphohydrolase [Magnetococcales bacterium]